MNHLNNGEINNVPPQRKSIRREFFNDLKEIIKKHIPSTRITDRDISRLFFNRERALSDAHLKGEYKYRRLGLSTLFSFIYKMRILTTNDFSEKVSKVTGINQDTLDKIKTNIEAYIEAFIFSNPFDIKYIGDDHISGTIHYKPEYDLTLNIWMKLSRAKKEPILLKHARKSLEYATFGRINRFGEPTKGKVYSLVGLMNMLNSLTTLIPSNSYAKVFECVWKYIELRGLYFVLPRVYHPSWYSLSTVKFHVIMLIIRDLGLDILNLEPIKPESFKNIHKVDSLTYIRHHIYPNDKMSLDVNRLVLVIRKYHDELEGKTNLVLNLIRNRIDLTFDCPQYYKNNLNKWKQRWEEYLERRTFLIQNGIMNFVDKYFTDDDDNNYIFERFFNNISIDNIEQNIKNLMLDWINKHRPAPILNIHIITKFFCGTPNLITSGFIHHKS